MKKSVLMIVLFISSYIVFSQNSDIQTLQFKINKYNQRIDSCNKQISSLEYSVAELYNRIDSIKFYSLINPNTTLISTLKLDVWLKDEPASYGKNIISLKKGDTISIIGFTNKWYYKVQVKNKYGYIIDEFINENEDLILFKKVQKKEEEQRLKNEKEQKSQTEAKLLEQEKKRAEKLIIEKKIEAERKSRIRKNNFIKKYGQVNGQKIYEGKIWLGMTKEMAIDSWGQPKDINRTVYSWGVHEQWIYNSNYLYFEDGILNSWQD